MMFSLATWPSAALIEPIANRATGGRSRSRGMSMPLRERRGLQPAFLWPSVCRLLAPRAAIECAGAFGPRASIARGVCRPVHRALCDRPCRKRFTADDRCKRCQPPPTAPHKLATLSRYRQPPSSIGGLIIPQCAAAFFRGLSITSRVDSSAMNNGSIIFLPKIYDESGPFSSASKSKAPLAQLRPQRLRSFAGAFCGGTFAAACALELRDGWLDVGAWPVVWRSEGLCQTASRDLVGESSIDPCFVDRATRRCGTAGVWGMFRAAVQRAVMVCL
jgi:hypothetical protein